MKITFVVEQQPSGQWVGTIAERPGFMVAEITIGGAFVQAAYLLTTGAAPDDDDEGSD